MGEEKIMARAPKARPKIEDPADVEVTDELRTWSAKAHGAMYLPDVYLQEFKDKAKARGTRYKDSIQALQNYINWESPAGKFYKADWWEKQIRRARKMEKLPPRLAMPEVTVAGRYVDDRGAPISQPPTASKPAADVARSAIARMQAQLRGAA